MVSGERLNAIRAMVVTEQAGSFAKAGERLGLSPSAVGKAISRLEARLGVRLFHRTTRSLGLTEEGRTYYESCLRALTELEAAEQVLARGKAEPSGRLRISLPDLFGRRKIAPILFDLARTYPELRLDLSFENKFIDLAEEGIDLVVRIGEPPASSGLIARTIGQHDLVLCAAPGYLEQAPALLDTADLSRHALLTQARGDGEVPWLCPGEKGTFKPLAVGGRHRFTHLDTVADAARASMGVAQLPRWLILDALASGALSLVLPHLPRPQLPINALWLQSRGMPPRTRVAIDAMAAALASTAPAAD